MILSAMLPALLFAPLVVADPRPYTMQDLSPTSGVGAEVMYGDMDISLLLLGQRDVDFWMVSLGGEFSITPEIQVGLKMPFAYVNCDCFGANPVIETDDDQFALGNITAFGRYAVRRDDLALGAGFSFSGLTASDDPENEGRAALLAGLWSLFRDPGLWLPDTNTFRGAGTGRLDLGRGYVQAEIGINYHLVDDDSDILDGDNTTVMRLALGGGFRVTEVAALQAELVTTSLVLDEDDDDNPIFGDDEWFHVLDVGGRFELPSVSLGARMSITLDDGGSDLIDDAIGFGVDVLARF